MERWKCQICNKEIDPNSKFCPHCGNPVTRQTEGTEGKKCRHCRSLIPAGADFCPQCGFTTLEIIHSIEEDNTTENNEESQTAKHTEETKDNSPAKRGKKKKPKWLLFVTPVLLIAVIIIVITCFSCNHEYAPATCTEPQTCIKCGKTNGDRLGHKWGATNSCDEPAVCERCGAVSTYTKEHLWYYSLSEIECGLCHKIAASADEIKSKKGKNLTSADRALIYNFLDYYLTATDSNGKYRYSEQEAFSKAESTFGVSRDYINNNIWNGYAYSDYMSYNH